MADKAEIIRMLNDDLTGEVEATLVYMHSHFVVTAHCPTQMEMFDIALDEMRHIEWLAEAIVELGGEPELTPRKVRYAASDPVAANRRGVELEKEAIEQYNAHIAAIADPKIQRLLAHIRDEEVDHLEEFEELLEEAEGPDDRKPTVGDLSGQSKAGE
ncbi:MAG: ferritin-like domain-containing protein [Armatimonadetes bacterium]|nr:ferritin-like domain-containing protein [Armatimonadota bacterium]